MITTRVTHLLSKIKEVLRPRDKDDYIILGLSIVLLLYTAVMAWFSDMSYDESFTYMYFAGNEGSLQSQNVANNHPLNSFLIHLSSYAFPYRDFAIRMPNLIFLVIYLACSIRVSKMIPGLKLLIFGMLTLYWMWIPFYFSQARGYGIAAALVLLFLVLFQRDTQNYKNIIRSFYVLLFATAAFPGLLPLTIAVCIYYLLFEIKLNILHFIKSCYVDLLILALGFAYLLDFLINVSGEGKPLYGSNAGFFESVTGGYLDYFSDWITISSHYILLSISILLTVSCLLLLWFKGKGARASIIMLITFGIFYISSNLSGRPYITGRLLMPFYPLIILALVELMKFGIDKFKPSKKLLTIISYPVFLLMIVNYVQKSNFSYDTDYSNYQTEIFDKYRFNIIDEDNWPPVLYYQKKFLIHGPLETIKQSPSTIFREEPELFSIFFYNGEYPLLLLEGLPEADYSMQFYLHIFPSDTNNLEENRKQYGFESRSFKWDGNNQYYIPLMPDYKYDSVQVGQYKPNNTQWKQVIEL